MRDLAQHLHYRFRLDRVHDAPCEIGECDVAVGLDGGADLRELAVPRGVPKPGGETLLSPMRFQRSNAIANEQPRAVIKRRVTCRRLDGACERRRVYVERTLRGVPQLIRAGWHGAIISIGGEDVARQRCPPRSRQLTGMLRGGARPSAMASNSSAGR